MASDLSRKALKMADNPRITVTLRAAGINRDDIKIATAVEVSANQFEP
jgi:hypothetical protein